MKPIILIIIVCVLLGYVGWKQQNQSLKQLKRLEKHGVKVDSFIYSRPMLAIDNTAKKVIVIYPDKTLNLKFREIKNIRFVESRYSDQQNSNPVGPDRIRIQLKDGRILEIRDLRKSARETMEQLQPFLNGVLLDFKSRF